MKKITDIINCISKEFKKKIKKNVTTENEGDYFNKQNKNNL